MATPFAKIQKELCTIPAIKKALCSIWHIQTVPRSVALRHIFHTQAVM
jgi:hypothetical protein